MSVDVVRSYPTLGLLQKILTHPYHQALFHVKVAAGFEEIRAERTALESRISHLALGVLLLVPIINAIALYLLSNYEIKKEIARWDAPDLAKRRLERCFWNQESHLSLRNLPIQDPPSLISHCHALQEIDLEGTNVQQIPHLLAERADVVIKLSLETSRLLFGRVTPARQKRLLLYRLSQENLSVELKNRVIDAFDENPTALDFSDLNLDSLEILPKIAWAFPNLNTLVLSGNNFQNFPEEALEIQGLNNLVLSDQQIELFSSESEILKTLKRNLITEQIHNEQIRERVLDTFNHHPENLDLSNLHLDSLESLPGILWALPHLNSLNLSGNHFQNFPEEVAQIPGLANLTLSEEQTKTLFSDLPLLKTLKRELLNQQLTAWHALPYAKNMIRIAFEQNSDRINLDGCSLQTLPDIFWALPALTKVSLSDNHLESLPEDFFGLEHLEVVNLSNNPQLNISGEIAQLNSLRDIKIRGLNLQEIPAPILELPLTSLDLKDNQISSLPENWGAMVESLVTLNLERNPLNGTLDSLLEVATLTHLQMNELQIQQFQCPELVSLKTAKRTFLERELNEWVQNAVSVGDARRQARTNILNCFNSGEEALSLSMLNLVGLPDIFWALPHLLNLDLRANELMGAPESFQYLQNLRILDLSGNHLLSVPAILEQMPRIRALRFNRNFISEVPDFLFAGFEENTSYHYSFENNIFSIEALEAIIAHGNANQQLTVQASIDHDPDFRVLYRDRNGAQLINYVAAAQQGNNANPPTTFENAVEILKTSSERPNFALPDITTAKKNHFLRFFMKLHASFLFRGSVDLRKKIATLLLNSFDLASENESFHSAFYELFEVYATTCHDRIALGTNRIYQKYHLYSGTLPAGFTLATFIMGIHRIDLIQAKAAQRHLLDHGEALETILALEVGLRRKLALPTIVESMIFRGCAQIHEDTIRAIGTEIFEETEKASTEIYINHPFWQEYLQKEYNEEYEKVSDFDIPNPDEDTFGEALIAHNIPNPSEDDSITINGAYSRLCVAISEKRDRAIREFYREKTEALLELEAAH